MGARRIGFRKKCLFAALTCSLVYFLLEVFLWVVGVPTLIAREDPFRGFSGLVSVFERKSTVYRTRRALVETTFNDQSFLADKPANGLRIFGMGGSSAFGFPWGADVAFTSIVGEAVATSHPERHVEAVNAAGISYAVHRENLVADELLAYRPDIFLIYTGHNEFIEPGFFESLKRRSATRTRLEYALSHSRLYSVLTLMKRRLRDQQPSSAAPMDPVVRRDQTRIYSPPEKEAIVAQFRQGLERLVRRAQEAGVKVVLSTIPCNLRDWRPQASAGVMSLTEPDRQRWSEAFALGQRRLKDADLAAALADLEQAARLAPQHAETQFLLAQAYEALGRFNEARAAYQRACDEDASPIRRVSGINEAIRDVAQRNNVLLVDMDQIFEKHSEHGLLGNNLIEDYVHPTPQGHQLIAWHMWDAMERAGWFGAKGPARQDLFDRILAERGSKAPSRNSNWFYNQGVILQHQGQIKAAIKSYLQSLQGNPNHTGALLNLGQLLIDTGQFNEAVKVCERLVALSPDSAEAHNSLGAALNQVARPQDSLSHLQQALRLKPDYSGAHNNLGNVLCQLGRPQEAIPHYQQALRLKPDDSSVHNNWGTALNDLRRPQEAIPHYQEALRLKPDYSEAHNNWGNALALQGELLEAVVHFQQALRLSPNNETARVNLRTIQEELTRRNSSSAKP